MKEIRIGIYLKNKQHAGDVAKALGEISPRLDITVLEYEFYYKSYEYDNYDIIITDRDFFKEYHPNVLVIEGKYKENLYDEYVCKDQVIDRHATAKEILAASVRIYERNMKIPFTQTTENTVKILSFLSFTGGSGVSAAAVTTGRYICMNSGKRVLYANIGGSDAWKLYLSDAEKAARSSREIPHLIQNDALFSIDSYVSVDRYGLCYLDRIEKPQIVLKKLCESGNYDRIILDMPEPAMDIEFDRMYLVRNDRDIRSRIITEQEARFRSMDNITEIVNRSPAAGREGNLLRIPEDRNSFVLTEGGVNIAMDGNFAMNLGKICEEWI